MPKITPDSLRAEAAALRTNVARITESSLRNRCECLTRPSGITHVFIEGFDICRVGIWSGVSLGNIEVEVFYGSKMVLKGRFGAIKGSLKSKINASIPRND